MATSDSTFDEPLNELRRQIQELEGFPPGSGQEKELDRLRHTLRKSTAEVYGGLNRWQKTLVARHPGPPLHPRLRRSALMTDWVELHGDRAFGDDPAIVSGFATFRGRSVAVIGHQKGRDTKERILPQLRPAAPRGLPQGAAGDEAGGAVRPARPHLHRHRRAPTPASTPRSAARPRRSPAT